MEQWATNYGMQKAQGVELYTSDGADYQLIANAPIAAGSSVLYVPSGQCDFIAPPDKRKLHHCRTTLTKIYTFLFVNLFPTTDIVLGSNAIQQELGGSLEAAENALVQMEQGLQFRLPLFRLMVKILAEWDAGEESPYFPWLVSLPHQFYNGVSMTGE